MVEYKHMNIVLYGFIFILGIVIGSFLNVVILRLHTNKISKGRSRCSKCAHVLSAKDLVPVLSHLFLKGRCRYCHSRLSLQYPIVEIMTAFVFVLIFWRVSNTYSELWQIVLFFIVYAKIFSLLIVMSVYDIRHYILPWKLMKLFLVLCFTVPIIIGFMNNSLSLEHITAGFITALPFWLIWYFSKGRMIGFGDIELMCGLGFLLGISAGFSAILISFWIGAAFVFLKILLSRKMLSGKTQVPFGPFLALGGFIVFIFSMDMMSFAINLI